MTDEPGRTNGGLLRCSFCGKTQAKVPKLIAGPDVYICSGCIAAARTWPPLPPPGRTCSFCGRWDPDKGPLTGKGSTAICAECLDLCDEILAEEEAG